MCFMKIERMEIQTDVFVDWESIVYPAIVYHVMIYNLEYIEYFLSKLDDDWGNSIVKIEVEVDAEDFDQILSPTKDSSLRKQEME